MNIERIIADAGADRPVLIAGPTASGKSALAVAIAETAGGVIVNADALQVFANWRLLSARPDAGDLARAPHALYGHIAPDAPYSTGHWLREVAGLLGGARPIIVGGTGLNLAALTEGLAEIPPTPDPVRAEADRRVAAKGAACLLADIDPATLARIDRQNPARIQRAWEVQATTGQGLAAWQDTTPPPLLRLSDSLALCIDAPPDWLNPRIALRFDRMLANGALDEVRANLPNWDPRRPASRAIGAPDLVAHLGGKMTLDEARAAVLIATRQYAKRQRTWFRKRMAGWVPLTASQATPDR